MVAKIKRVLEKKSVVIAFVVLALWWFCRRVSLASGNVSIDSAFDILRNSEYSSLTDNWKYISKMETAGWSSSLCLNSHNLFGMRQPVQRQTKSAGDNGSGFATFGSFQDSVSDLVLYLRAQNYPKQFDSLYDQIGFMQTVKGWDPGSTVQQYYDAVNAWKNKDASSIDSAFVAINEVNNDLNAVAGQKPDNTSWLDGILMR